MAEDRKSLVKVFDEGLKCLFLENDFIKTFWRVLYPENVDKKIAENFAKIAELQKKRLQAQEKSMLEREK